MVTSTAFAESKYKDEIDQALRLNVKSEVWIDFNVIFKIKVNFIAIDCILPIKLLLSLMFSGLWTSTGK